jgi:hypothetical protein
MRVYGRTYDEFGNATWNVVETDPQGNNEYVYLTWMVQVLKLVLGESPFYANVGIPAVQSVVQQIFPDFYVAQVQTQFQQYFASLIISKVPGTSTPTYNVNVLFYNGTQFQATIST